MTDGGPDDFINRYRKRTEAPKQTAPVPEARHVDDARAGSSDDDLPPLVEAPPGPGFPDQDADAAALSLEEPLDGAMRRAEAVSLARIRHALVAEGIAPESVGAPESMVRDSLHPPPKGSIDVVKVDLGVGKTHKLIEFALRFLEGRYGAEPRPMGLRRRVGILVPDHKLARELFVRINDVRPGACMIWKGSEQPLDPDNPEGEKMCLRAGTDVPIIQRAGCTLSNLCQQGSKKDGTRVLCPHHPENTAADAQIPCAYRLQKDLGTPIVIICGSGALTQALPPAFRRSLKIGEKDIPLDCFDLLILDEVRVDGFLGGFGNKPYVVEAATIDRWARLARTRRGEQLNFDTGLLRDPEWSVLEADMHRLQALLDGGDPLTLGDLRAIYPTPKGWLGFRRLLLRLKVNPSFDPRLTGDELANSLGEALPHNAGLIRLSRLCLAASQAIGSSEAPDEILAQTVTRHRDGLQITWREQLAGAYEGLPTLLCDATADLAILQALLPGSRLIADARAAIPSSVEIVQVWDSLHPYTGWVPNARHRPEAAARVEHNITRLANLLDVLAERFAPGDVAAIVPLRTEKALRELWQGQNRRPEPVRLAHFNAIRGLDTFKDVRCLVVWSRPSPPPREVERMAATIFGCPVEMLPADQPYPKEKTVYRMRDGTCREALAEHHPDPLVESVRRQIVEAELLQAIGRARAVRRDASRPLTMLIGTSAPTPLPINRLVRSKALLSEATPIDAMMARGLLVEPGKGFAQVAAAALGMQQRAINDLLRRAPGLRERVECRLSDTQTPIRDNLLRFAYLRPRTVSHWKVRLTATDRYGCNIRLVGIAHGDQAAARALLRTFNGLDPAELTPVMGD